MSTVAEHMDERAKQALAFLQKNPGLRAKVAEEVNGFFARNPGTERDELTAGFIAQLAIDRLSADADSQSASA